MHPAQTWFLKFLIALQQIDLCSEAEYEYRECEHAAFQVKQRQSIEILVIVTLVAVERVDHRNNHDVCQCREPDE